MVLRRWLYLLLSMLLASGCATVPPEIKRQPPGNLQLIEVLEEPAAHQGTRVRWGGTIVSVSEEGGVTWAEILERKLYHDGGPNPLSASDGRFLARFEQRPEAKEFMAGRDITVYGTLDGASEGTIGRKPYTFPVVRVEVYYLWGPYPVYYDPIYWPGRGYPYGYGRDPWGYYW